jgi:PKD repeat protein
MFECRSFSPKKLGFLFLFLMGASPCFASTVYVSPNGNDSNPGTLDRPLATPARAIALASPGDTIYFRAGRYAVTRFLWIDKDGLTLASHPGELATIAGSNTDTTNLQSVIVIVSNNVSIIGLEIQGGSYYSIKVESNSGTLLRNCKIHSSGRDCIKMYNADQMTIENCEIGPSGLRDPSNAEGIDSVGGRNTVIRGCYIHDIATNGLYLKGGASGCLVERNRVERTGHAGILLGQDTDIEFMRDGTRYEALNSIVRNNIVINTGGAGVGTYSGYNVRFYNNTLWDVARSYHAGFYVVTNTREVPSERVSFKNNIVVVMSSRPMAFVINLADALASDYNIWFRPTGGAYRFSRESGSSADYWESLADWQRGMGADLNSKAADPRLGSDYKPLAGSPAIDAGQPISEVTNDYSGGGRPQGAGYDIGAYEVSGSAQPPSNRPPQVSASAQPQSGVAPLSVSFTAVASDPDGQIVSYRWDFGDGGGSSEISPRHVYSQPGDFTARVTVTDSGGASATAAVTISVSGDTPPPPATGPQKVIWTNVVGCSVSDNTLTKTAESTWGNAGAASAQQIENGDGYVEFTAIETDKERMAGLSNGDTDRSPQDIDFAVHLNTGGAFYVVEGGTSRGYFGDYRSGDVFRVAVESGTVKYYRNGAPFYTSQVAPRYPLLLDASLNGQGSTIANAIISGTSSRDDGSNLSLSVRLLSPKGNEILVGKSKYTISWAVSGQNGEPVTVTRQDIKLSLDDGLTWADIVVGLAGNVSSYNWTVPKIRTSMARIKVIVYRGDQRAEAISDRFRIIKRALAASN